MAKNFRQSQQNATENAVRRLAGRAAVRPVDAVPHGVPVALRSAQHVIVSNGRFEPFATPRVILVEWVISGEAAMMAQGRLHTFKPGHAAIYLPTDPLRFWAVAPRNEMCWFTVDGPLAEPLAMQLELHSGVYPSGPPPIQQIHEMMDLLTDHTIQGWRRASLLAIRVLYELADSIHAPQTPSAVRQVQHLVQQEFADPDLSVTTLAARLQYHRGAISRLFHRQTGVTIVDYIAQTRLQQSKALLQHTPEKVAQVARKCGFRDTAYFCRWFRAHTGFSPSHLRDASAK